MVITKLSNSNEWPSGSLKVTGIDVIQWATYDFLLVFLFHCKYDSILHRPQEIISYCLLPKI